MSECSLQELSIWAYPKTVKEFEDALVCCMKENPEPVIFKVACTGVKPELEPDKKTIFFDRVLLHRCGLTSVEQGSSAYGGGLGTLPLRCSLCHVWRLDFTQMIWVLVALNRILSKFSPLVMWRLNGQASLLALKLGQSQGAL